MGALPDRGGMLEKTGKPMRLQIFGIVESLESLRHGLFGYLTSEGWRMSRREFWKRECTMM